MILCCGEALIDMLPRETREGLLAFEPKVGGSLFNTAVALGRLGVPSGFFGGLSRDFFGDDIRRAMAASHVDFSFSPVSERYTLLAFVKLDRGQARYSFIDEGSACRMLSTADLPVLGPDVLALHLGSFPLALEPLGSTIEALCARERGARVICCDPNIRPAVVKDRDAYLARVARVTAMADIVKLSDEDLKWMRPDATSETYAKDCLSRGTNIVVMTRGSEGAAAFTKTYRCDVPGQAVRVADTVGAGDTFTAGLLASLHRNVILNKDALKALPEYQLHEALSFATRAASITVSRPGADPPWAHELEGIPA